MYNSWLRCITIYIYTVGTERVRTVYIFTKDLMEKTHQMPTSIMVKERKLIEMARIIMQLVIQTIICMVKHPTRVSGLLLLDGLQRPCGSWMHYLYAMRL